MVDIIEEVDRLLEVGRFQDYALNGLQVPGPDQVEVVASGVSAHLELFEAASEVGAGLLVVHHGLFWGPGVRSIDRAMKRRLKVVFDADMALAAYHLPLDAHPELGNNALIARALGAISTEPFALHEGEPIGCLAELPDDGMPAVEFFRRVGEITSRAPLVFDFGPDRVRRVGIVSGAASDDLLDAAAAGADAFITGEPAERVMAEAREARVHFIAAGHYATETFGVRALGEHLARRFGVRHVFLDVPNPV